MNQLNPVCKIITNVNFLISLALLTLGSCDKENSISKLSALNTIYLNTDISTTGFFLQDGIPGLFTYDFSFDSAINDFGTTNFNRIELNPLNGKFIQKSIGNFLKSEKFMSRYNLIFQLKPNENSFICVSQCTQNDSHLQFDSEPS